MKIFAIANNKGGVGKTTTAINLAADRAFNHKERTLLIDVDGQCSMSQRYLSMESDPNKSPILDSTNMPPIHPDYDPDDPDAILRPTFIEIYNGNITVPYPTRIENLDIIPAWSTKIYQMLHMDLSAVQEEVYLRPAQFCSYVAEADAYDTIIFDTPPAKNPLSIGAVRAATHVIVPCAMEEMSLEGLVGMLELVKLQNKARANDTKLSTFYKEPAKTLIYANRADFRKRIHLDNFEALRSHPMLKNYMIEAVVRENSQIMGYSAGKPIDETPFEWPASSTGRKMIEEFCNAINERL